MLKPLTFLTISACLGLFALSGCSDSNRQEVKQEARETKRDFNEERREWMNSLDARMNKLDNEWDEAKADWNKKSRKAKAKTRREYNERITDLEKSRAELREQYNKAKDATADTWQDVKNNMSSGWDKFEEKSRQLMNDLKS